MQALKGAATAAAIREQIAQEVQALSLQGVQAVSYTHLKSAWVNVLGPSQPLQTANPRFFGKPAYLSG